MVHSTDFIQKFAQLPTDFPNTMSHHYHFFLLGGALFILLTLWVSRFAARFGVPSLLATLALGMAFGNGGPFDFDYNYPSLTLHISEIALSIIIFTGGLETRWKSVQPVLWQGISLASLGVVLTMISIGFLAHWWLHWDWIPALLMGALVSATDAAAVFSILENIRIKLVPGVREVLELESGANDPMAFFLTISLTTLLIPGGDQSGWAGILGHFLQSMAVGLGTGLLAGKFIHLFLKRIPLKKGQFPIVLLAWVVILYAVNSLLGGSAFLAVYVTGIILGNSPWGQRELNLHFFESMSWLMETGLFLVLGLQVYVRQLPDVLWEGLLISAGLMLLARPIGVWASLAFFRGVSTQKKNFYAWVGLRGATPIVFALIPVVAGVPYADKLFNIAFIVVITSILFQGATVRWMAELTGVRQR
ncbi:MAG: potassium/proton antiporter [Saprospiraceae bacterium]|nr:potassium/proton antiporter [Saprospiraceae bacterium]